MGIEQEKKSLSNKEFISILENYGIEGFRSTGSRRNDSYITWVLDVKNNYSFQGLSTRLLSWEVTNDEKRTVDYITLRGINPQEPSQFQKSSKLKKILEREGIPFEDRRDVNECKKRAKEYANMLLEASENL